MDLANVVSSRSLVALERHGLSMEQDHEGKERRKVKIRPNTINAKVRVDQLKNRRFLRLGISGPWS